MKYYDSVEVEMLRKLIADKLNYLPHRTNPHAYRHAQKEILFLQNDILPIVLNNTNVVHSEIAKATVLAFDTGLKYKVNGLLTYFPIDENYTENPIMGMYNTRSHLKFGTPGAVEIYCEIINMDGYGAKFSTCNLSLKELMYGSK